MNKNVIIIGASGHGKVIAEIVEQSQDHVIGFLDDGIKKGSIVLGYEVLGTISDHELYPECEFIIGIGNNVTRKMIANTCNVNWYTAIHPTAIISNYATICEGTVVMANAIINTSTQIGQHCIINTGAIIEHDNRIDDYVHVSPNATLCGTVHVGELTHIGASATIRNNITIGNNIVVGAGSVVVKDLKEEAIYVGVPARKL